MMIWLRFLVKHLDSFLVELYNNSTTSERPNSGSVTLSEREPYSVDGI